MRSPYIVPLGSRLTVGGTPVNGRPSDGATMRVGQRVVRVELRTRQALERRREADIPPRQRISDLPLHLRLERRRDVAVVVRPRRVDAESRTVCRQAEIVLEVAVVDALTAEGDATRQDDVPRQPCVDVEVEAVIHVVDAADVARVEDQVVGRDDAVDVEQPALLVAAAVLQAGIDWNRERSTARSQRWSRPGCASRSGCRTTGVCKPRTPTRAARSRAGCSPVLPSCSGARASR